MIIDSAIQGIPCKIQVHSIHIQEPMGPSAPSSYDCYGYTEIEFEVLDRRGYSAPWLDRKMTEPERIEIEEQIMKEKAHRENRF